MLAVAMIASLMTPASDARTEMRRLETMFEDPISGFFIESTTERHPVYNWGIGVLLSAQNALTRLDPSNKPKLEQSLEKAMLYWNPVGPVPGFDVQPNVQGGQDRYYDDNAWMVMALVESYEITGNPKWLERAKESLKYVLSGEDEKLGGGIYWKEREKTSKNTCSNGPSAAACLAVFRHTHEQKLLEKAKTLYSWTKKTLQAPDGLYWDNIQLGGKIDRTKWSYNSALMLRTSKELAAITHEPSYVRDAERLEAASLRRWVKPDGTIDDELQFAHLLFENLDPKKIDAKKCIEKLLEGRGRDGFFGTRWGKPSDGKHQLLHQASAVRALAVYELSRLRK